jgi:uroporphyrinogen decarboxylase
MKINMKQWQKDLLNSSRTNAFPLMGNFGASLKGLSIKDVVTDGEKQASCIKATSELYDLCAFVTLMDLSVEAEAFGCEVSMSENEIPTVRKSLVADMSSAVKLEIPDPALNRTSVYIKAAGLISVEIAKPVFGCLIGPFSLAGRLMDMTNIFISLFNNPGVVHLVLEKCAAFLTAYATAFKNAGASGILMAEPAGSLISPVQCSEFSSSYIRKIVESVQDDYFTVILHNCGKTLRHVESMLSTGTRALHFGNAVDLSLIAPKIPPDIMFMGNLDPVSVFMNGSSYDVNEKTNQLLESMKDYRNYIISSGCDIPPATGRTNFDAFFNAVTAYNQQNQNYDKKRIHI